MRTACVVGRKHCTEEDKNKLASLSLHTCGINNLVKSHPLVMMNNPLKLMLFDLGNHFPFPFSSHRDSYRAFDIPDISVLPLQAFSQASEEFPFRLSFLALGLG